MEQFNYHISLGLFYDRSILNIKRVLTQRLLLKTNFKQTYSDLPNTSTGCTENKTGSDRVGWGEGERRFVGDRSRRHDTEGKRLL